MITHIVLFTLIDQADREDAMDRLRSLRGQIPTLLSLECGADDLGGENHYDFALISTHPDGAGLADYQAHPVHLELLVWLRPRLSGRVVVDTSSLM